MRRIELACIECGERSSANAAGWRGYLVDLDDDGGDEVAFYCPRCAAREFGDNLRRTSDGPPFV